MNHWLARLDAAGRRLEDLLLSAILVTLIGLASWQIFGRNLFGTTLATGDELLRILVLWLTLAASVAASRADRHIAISLLDRFVSGWKLNLVRTLNHAFTAVVCALLARYSFDFVQLSREFGDTLLGDVPAWWLQAPLPIGFGLMAYRHTLHAVKSLLGRMPEHDDALGVGGRES